MRGLAQWRLAIVAGALLGAADAHAPAPTVRGYWREPSGSVIRIAPCNRRLCLDIVALPAGHNDSTDVHNPDPKLRQRPLCGLRIGEGFVELEPQHAQDGSLYDPKSGRTYSGEMTAARNRLELRGYIGLRLFGRTETWARVSRAPPPCPRGSRSDAPRRERARRP